MTPQPSNSQAPIVAWARRHKVISGLIVAYVALMIVVGIVSAALTHSSSPTPNINANLHYVPSLNEYCSTYACYPPGWTPGN
jgi:hypothetical protein